MNNKRQIVKKYSEVVTNVEDVQIIKSKYDELCKKVLSNKYILAWILKSVVKEYELEGIETIREKYIEGVVDCSKKLISSQSKCMEIEGRRNENLILGEGVRIFDIVFAAITPISHDKLIVNIEPQNEYYPGYVIDTRMIYYLARMISSQYGKEFNKSNYNDIKKVYSIWVCTDSPKGEANSISIYEMNRSDFVGKQKDRRKSYNKMIGIKICLGGEQEKNYTGVIKLLHVLLVSNISIEEKRKILVNEFRLPTRLVEKEVKVMCNYSEGIYNKGVKAGMQQGMQQGEILLSMLIKKLMQDSRNEDVLEVTEDADYREKLYIEYGIK